MSQKTIDRMVENQKLRERIEKVKPLLPKHFRQIILERYPEYNSVKGYTLINNVVRLRTANEKITAILEEIAQAES